MRKAIFGLVVVGLLIWAVQFMKSSQTDTADAVIPAPVLSQEAPAAIIDAAATSTATGITAVTDAAQAAGTEAQAVISEAASAIPAAPAASSAQ